MIRHETSPMSAGLTMSPPLQILVIYVAASVATGLPLGVALGAMIRRAERRHRQHVAQLMRSRTLHTIGSLAEPREARAR
jgi:hypothetical protein